MAGWLVSSPLAGSAFSYVGRSIHPAAGFLTGWGMVMDYMLNPILCSIFCSKAMMNILPGVPYAVFAVFFALLFTFLNLRGVKTNARNNQFLVIILSIVVIIFMVYGIRYLIKLPELTTSQFIKPFYDPTTFFSFHCLIRDFNCSPYLHRIRRHFELFLKKCGIHAGTFCLQQF